ncbi:hypothetical protein ACFQL7_20695 [Halocatena marina]|uniref:Uncharacterized protein n=1 Tax=Halocatena marina TaxID=2934937 RepID=A0ABD5YVN7_9EURY|nr:hypothetical protein [Halocatena marina]
MARGSNLEAAALEYIKEFGLGTHFLTTPYAEGLTQEQCEELICVFDPVRHPAHYNLCKYVQDSSRIRENI